MLPAYWKQKTTSWMKTSEITAFQMRKALWGSWLRTPKLVLCLVTGGLYLELGPQVEQVMAGGRQDISLETQWKWLHLEEMEENLGLVIGGEDSEVGDRGTKIRPSKSRLSEMLTKMFVTFAAIVRFGRFKWVNRSKFNSRAIRVGKKCSKWTWYDARDKFLFLEMVS